MPSQQLCWRALAGGADLFRAAGLAEAVLLSGRYMWLFGIYPESSDTANILCMGWCLLHGNPLPHGWHMSDISVYGTPFNLTVTGNSAVMPPVALTGRLRAG
jgi:hypothetical protein